MAYGINKQLMRREKGDDLRRIWHAKISRMARWLASKIRDTVGVFERYDMAVRALRIRLEFFKIDLVLKRPRSTEALKNIRGEPSVRNL